VSRLYDLPVRQMIREAVEELGSPTANVAIRDYIERKHPGTNRDTINCQRIVCTVNQPSRVHYPENEKPRVADDPRYDFLFCPAKGQVEWYTPEVHGVWSIEVDGEGRLAICCDEGELIYTGRPPRTGGGERRAPVGMVRRGARPVLASQIEAANRLHDRVTTWAATNRAFELLRERAPGFSHEECLLKAAVINDLYSTNVFALWRMAEHLVGVMRDPPSDPSEVVEALASLPPAEGETVARRYWSFASKFAHFFIDAGQFPLYDSFSRTMVVRHLGRAECVPEGSNPYRAFRSNVLKLLGISRLSCSLRELDRYFWLAGQYEDWLDRGAEAPTNAALRALFEDGRAEVQEDLQLLLQEGAESSGGNG